MATRRPYEPPAITGSASLSAGENAKGVDVSGYQPIVDWAKAVEAGISFAFIKATEATTLVDRMFAAHWGRAKNAGVLRGAYHFFRPTLDAGAQAKRFVEQLGERGELPPVLDVEVSDGVDKSAILAGVSEWLDVVTAEFWQRPIVYTSPGFWNSLPSSASIASKADLWVAHWGARSPAPVNGWSKWTFWQFTNKANVSGIPGAGADENQFNGSVADLRAYSGHHRTAFDLETTLGLQQALNFLSVVSPPLAEDGVMGPKTKAAIEAFQARAGIWVDGIVGPATIAALTAALG